MIYDSIVVGGGHAGIEAALALAKMKKNTLLVTGNLNKVASLPCNPSIGGPAKGVVVREIDALGGVQAKIADRAQIQMKLLNGVVLPPSALGITLASPPSITDTTEFVVPKSIPIILFVFLAIFIHSIHLL